MRRTLRRLFACALVLLAAENAFAAPQPSDRRVALVIGNGAYREAPLKNPVNDARDMAAALRRLGFEVTLLTDADLKRMDSAVRDFGMKLRQGGTGLFYYAGHGLQVGGENYLVPVGANIQSESDVRYSCLPAGVVLGRMDDARNDVNIIVLDACRNNPFARGFRSAGQGLAKMNAPTGSLISYATAPGSVAADGDGRNGLYTQHLLKNLAIPGLPITEVFMRVRQGVVAATGRKQVPWEASSLIGQFYFAGGAGTPVAPMPVPPVTDGKLPATGQRPQQSPGQSPDNSAAFAQLARADVSAALASFEGAVQAYPADPDARAGLCMALVFADREADARYQLQRLNETGAQTPASRLATGLLLGLEGSADAAYQFSRAAEEGADRALALLCQAAVAVRRSDFERGVRLMGEHAGLVPEAERGAYAVALARRLDVVNSLVGTFDWKLNPDAFFTGIILKLSFTRQDGKLAGGGSGTIGSISAKVRLVEAQFRGAKAVLRLEVDQPLVPNYLYRLAVDLSGSPDSLLVESLEFGNSEADMRGSEYYPPRVSALVRIPDPVPGAAPAAAGPATAGK